MYKNIYMYIHTYAHIYIYIYIYTFAYLYTHGIIASPSISPTISPTKLQTPIVKGKRALAHPLIDDSLTHNPPNLAATRVPPKAKALVGKSLCKNRQALNMYIYIHIYLCTITYICSCTLPSIRRILSPF